MTLFLSYGLPIPILSLQKFLAPSCSIILFSPLCPPLPPPCFSLTLPTSRSKQGGGSGGHKLLKYFQLQYSCF